MFERASYSVFDFSEADEATFAAMIELSGRSEQLISQNCNPVSKRVCCTFKETYLYFPIASKPLHRATKRDSGQSALECMLFVQHGNGMLTLTVRHVLCHHKAVHRIR